jgi:hypothetical protein
MSGDEQHLRGRSRSARVETTPVAGCPTEADLDAPSHPGNVRQLLRRAAPLLILTWMLAGIVVMREASRLVTSVQTQGFEVDIGNLFDWTWSFEPVAIRQAWASWTVDPEFRADIGDWILAHAVVDTFTVTPVVFVVLILVMRWASPPNPVGVLTLPVCYLLADILENVCIAGFAVLAAGSTTGEPSLLFWALFLLSKLKWLAIAAVLLVAVLKLARGGRDEGTPPKEWSAAWRLRIQVIGVLLLGAMVALPGGGPLDQLPDITRAQIGPIFRPFDTSPWVGEAFRRAGGLVVPLLCVLLLCLAIWRSGLMLLRLPLDGSHQRVQRTAPPRAVIVILLVAAVAIPVVLFTVGVFTDGGSSLGVFAVPLLIGAAIGLDRSAAFMKRQRQRRRESAVEHSDLAGTSDQFLEVPAGNEDDLRAIGQSQDDIDALRVVLANLAVAPVCIVAIGVVRAFAGPMLTSNHSADSAVHSVPAGFLVFAGVALGLIAAGLVGIVESATAREQRVPSPPKSILGALTLLLTVGLLLTACVGVFRPYGLAGILSTSDILLCWIALVVWGGGCINFLTERYVPLPELSGLRIKRTPVLALGAVAFLVAGELDNTVAYHETPLTSNAVQQMPLSAAFTTWLGEMDECWKEASPIPMVLVAAPGGGIRAAYWTALGLSEIARADTQCRGGTIFLASGVSGGSMGLTAWTANPDRGVETVREMSQGRALAPDVASLLYRDLPRTLLALKIEDADRAAQFEAALAGAEESMMRADFFAAVGGVRDPDVGGALPWKPVLVLNSTDLATGCRIVITHLSGLAPSAVPPKAESESEAAGATPATLVPMRPDCQGRRITDDSTAVLQRAWDFADFNYEHCESDTETARRGGLSAITAAHMSARFPVISPMGALRWCADDPDNNEEEWFAYAADGGYLENSGMQALIQLWPELSDLVRVRNADSNKKPIQPYVVLLENDVMSQTASPPPDRLEELPAIAGGRDLAEPLTVNSMLDQLTVLMNQTGPNLAAFSRVQRWSPEPGVPGVAAPLGWTLSDQSRSTLGQSMRHVCQSADPNSFLRMLNAGRAVEC